MKTLRFLLSTMLLLGSSHVYAQNQLNIVVIMVDDMAQHMLSRMPLTRNVLASPGITFNQAIDEFALCCPSRVTFLLGKYAHNHGVEANSGSRGGWSRFRTQEGQTVAVKLRNVGYRTAMIGNYVNGYPNTGAPLHVPPGWNNWVALQRNAHNRMQDPGIIRNGVRQNLSGWVSDRCSGRGSPELHYVGIRRERALFRVAVVLRAAYAGDSRRPARQFVCKCARSTHAGVQ
jgi:arylsulfatase A-like enzyme